MYKNIEKNAHSIKSNKNSHTLALMKLEKDLLRILKHMSSKVFENDV